MDPVLSEWSISLERWALQDGNYTDFVVGQERQFALEFGYARTARLRVSDSSEPSVRHAGHGDFYAVRGELLRDSPDPSGSGFVLDFGLRAYSTWMVLDDLEPPSAGTWLEGEITLFVDPFEYMDRLALQDGMPPLIYTWRISTIEMDVSPSIRVEHGDPLYGGPDEGAERYVAVERTQMWEDPGSYRLRCALLPDEATSSMARSGVRSPYGPLTSR